MPNKITGDMPRCFLAVPYSQSFPLIVEAIHRGASEAGYEIIALDEAPVLPGSTVQESIISGIASADCIIADVSGRNPNIFFELGLAQAMGKGMLLISNEDDLRNMPFDIREFRVLTYKEDSRNLVNFSDKIAFSLKEFSKFPGTRRPFPIANFLSLPFYVDWDSLSPRDMENLCRELLSQMGFRRLDWGKGLRDFDLIAELPKKDPDGFEYKELWLIGMGLHMPIEMSFDMVSHGPEYLAHRLSKYFNRPEGLLFKDYDATITFLLILFRKGQYSEDLEMLRERIERRRLGRDSIGLNFRLRIWDQDYLTSLVQKFANIGYKYFSDEGRIRSKTRKSYEELYTEYSSLSARQQMLINALEEEKNKRIRAERDAIWKDISFSAAHKIGNPIFAIETDLDPLTKRIREERRDDAIEVVENIHSSVEKAKSFVEQFKSLARAQEIKSITITLRPLLEDACKSASNKGVICKITCPQELEIQGDPERLAECFDELVVNATHWLDKPEKKIEIMVSHPAPEPLPNFLDSSKKYVLIHFKDNGRGVATADKSRIFDAFFTTHEHGTGLGLALVRRIIDGHGGGITESGVPGKGADFEVFLPLITELPTQQLTFADSKNNKSKAKQNAKNPNH